MGNRSVPAANVWAMVQAMEKAFPVLMSPAVDAVRAMTAASHPTAEYLALLWVQKVSQPACCPPCPTSIDSPLIANKGWGGNPWLEQLGPFISCSGVKTSTSSAVLCSRHCPEQVAQESSEVHAHVQGSEDGSLPFLISRVRTQPQVYTAYRKTAPLRDKALSAELEAAVSSLKASCPVTRSMLICIHMTALAWPFAHVVNQHRGMAAFFSDSTHMVCCCLSSLVAKQATIVLMLALM